MGARCRRAALRRAILEAAQQRCWPTGMRNAKLRLSSCSKQREDALSKTTGRNKPRLWSHIGFFFSCGGET